jgi:hypothetical protein
VTNLVETISLTLTLHRDEADDFPFDDILGLKCLPRRGRQRIGNCTYEWVREGCVEVPEIAGGDN